MFTLLFAGGVLLFLGILSTNNKVSNFLLTGFVLLSVLSLVSITVSDSHVLNSYEEIERYGFRTTYVTDGTNVYAINDVLARWIPFYPSSLELCEAPYGYCAGCHKIWTSSYCEDCGAKVKQKVTCCPTCKAQCSSSFCGRRG